MNYRNLSQRRQERSLDLAKNYYETLFCEETLDVRSYRKQSWRATWWIDLKSAEHYWSKEFYEMMGFAPGIVPDILYWLDILKSDDLVTFSSYIERIEEDGKAREFSFTIFHQGDQAERTIKCCMDGVKEKYSNEIVMVIGTCYDITDGDYFESAQEIKKLRAQKELNRQLLAILAHDFKNPFNSIMGLVELLLKNKTTDQEKIELYLRTILSSAKTANSMMVRLTEWTKSQNEKWNVTNVGVDLHNLTVEIFDELKVIASNKNIELVNRCKKETIVFTDHEMLRIILRNLVSNAIKYSFQGNPVFVSALKTDKYFQISVKDHGIGMWPLDAKQLFEKHINNSTSGTANEKGTGIGISICKELVTKLNGNIWVESGLGEGCTFHFTLPC
jgi:nitrogen fixation/metabolism regulation signal transduction histidine kinase